MFLLVDAKTSWSAIFTVRTGKAYKVEFGSTFRVHVCTFFFFFFFFFAVVIFDQFSGEQCIHELFMDPQISLFSNFFIKNGSHSIIHTFKNYFVTVFTVFNFSKINYIQTELTVKQMAVQTANASAKKG